MKRVLILHGWGGSDHPHWQAYLADKLRENHYVVSFPNFPNRDLPDLDEWLSFLYKEIKAFRPESIVCHSLANILWFHYVNRYEVDPVEKLMLVAPVSPTCDIPELSTFFPYSLPSDLRAKSVIMASGDNDPYLSIDEAYQLHDILGIGLKVLENGGHINPASGFGELSCAYDWIVR